VPTLFKMAWKFLHYILAVKNNPNNLSMGKPFFGGGRMTFVMRDVVMHATSMF
jgi:hypothetical protein